MAQMNLFHRVRLPGAEAGQLHPAVVMVHGYKGNEKVMTIFERTLPPGVVVLTPRAPLKVEDDSYSWFEDGEVTGDLGGGLQALDAFVAAAPQAYPVDPARVALMGFSQGGAVCLALALSQPERVMAVASLAGFLPPAAAAWAAPGRLAGMPCLVTHGTYDKIVPLELARLAADAMRKAGADVTYSEHKTGHKMNARGMGDIRRWLAGVLAEPGAPDGSKA